jgi:hypothetical protein
MQNQGTSVLVKPETPTSDVPAVFGLTYGELAVALYASDLPTRAMRGVPRLELIEWAAQGLDRIGAELAWWTDYRSRRIGGCETWSAGQRAEYTRMWPNAPRARAAYDGASRLTGIGGPTAAAIAWPGTDRSMYEIFWAGSLWKVPVRDLENAHRYPHRTATDPHLSAMLRAYVAPGWEE